MLYLDADNLTSILENSLVNVKDDNLKYILEEDLKTITRFSSSIEIDEEDWENIGFHLKTESDFENVLKNDLSIVFFTKLSEKMQCVISKDHLTENFIQNSKVIATKHKCSFYVRSKFCFDKFF